MPRAKRLTTAEAAARVGVSERQMCALAKSHWIGKKEAGRWTFTETEIRKLVQERNDHAAAVKLRKRLENERRQLNGLPPKRKKKKRPARRNDYDELPRRRRKNDPLTIDDILAQQYDPIYQLDRILAHRRAIEQRFDLPFIPPASTRYGLAQCPHCGANAMLIIDCDNARDEAGIDGYERLNADLIAKHQLPTLLRLPPKPEPPDPSSRMMLRLRWPNEQRPAEVRIVSEEEWNHLIDEIVGGHCGAKG